MSMHLSKVSPLPRRERGASERDKSTGPKLWAFNRARRGKTADSHPKIDCKVLQFTARQSRAVH